MSDDTNQLKQQIDFGFQVQAFLQSEVGQHLIHRAESQIAAALEQLKVVDPEDARAIRAIQNEIRVAEDIQYWLAEAITTGQVAEQQLIDQHS